MDFPQAAAVSPPGWFLATGLRDLKTVGGRKAARGFESHPAVCLIRWRRSGDRDGSSDRHHAAQLEDVFVAHPYAAVRNAPGQ